MMAPKLTPPVNWPLWIAAGTVIAPKPDKPINWPGLTLAALTMAALASWWWAHG